MTDCPNATIRDRLPDLLHGALDAPARVAVEAHVAACGDCTRELALLRDARAALATRVAPVDVARIVAALPRPAVTGPRLVQFPSAAERARRGGRRRAGSWVGLAAAAVLALAVGIGTVATRLGTPAADVAPALADAGSSARPAADVVAAPDAAPSSPRAAATRGESAPLLVVNTAALSDADLAGLLDELDDLEAVPAADPMSLVPVAELPTRGVGAGDGS